jgi:hypothetical protein
LQDPQIFGALEPTLKQHQITSLLICDQFNGLILKLLNSVSAQEEGPFMIIINGLDECEDHWESLAMLAQETETLPANICFIIMS